MAAACRRGEPDARVAPTAWDTKRRCDAPIRRGDREIRDTTFRQGGTNHRRRYRDRSSDRAGVCAGRRGRSRGGTKTREASRGDQRRPEAGRRRIGGGLRCDPRPGRRTPGVGDRGATRAAGCTGEQCRDARGIAGGGESRRREGPGDGGPCKGGVAAVAGGGINEEEWDRVMTVNVKGPFLMSRAVLPEFRKWGGGAIVNIGSVLGLVAMKDRAAYCASKGGVTMLTKAMAVDHGHENIRVNCICPSIVETELVKGLFDASGQGDALRTGGIALIPRGRFGQPPDVAEIAGLLTSGESAG